MKNKYYFILFMVAAFTWSCNDSFLDLAPTDQLSDVSFWETKDDLEKYTTSIYRYLVQPENHTIMTDCYTDNAVPVHIFAEQGELSAGTATASNPHFAQIWQEAYQGIRRCNVYMENIDNVDVAAESKASFTGEVHFLRSFFYYTLMKYFGGVPIITHVMEFDEDVPARNSTEEMYDFIIKELDIAIGLLPVKQADLGRVTKGAAIALKAVVASHLTKYGDAMKYAKQVMDMNNYEVIDSFEDLFLPHNKDNKEVIFARQYMENAPNSKLGSSIDQFFAPMIMGGWEAVSPTQDLVDTYECIDGKSIKESPLYDENDPFANRDPRLAYTILWDGTEIAGLTYTSERMGAGNVTRTGYSMRKYINPLNSGMKKRGWTNFILMRYADILLLYAEAKNEIDGPDTSVYDAVNQVRQRASVGLPPLTTGLSKDAMREAIRKERRLELAFEGVYFFDTKRWKTTEQAVKKPVYGKKVDGEHSLIETRSFDPNKQYLWGIPLNEIDLSKGVLKQNPGY